MYIETLVYGRLLEIILIYPHIVVDQYKRDVSCCKGGISTSCRVENLTLIMVTTLYSCNKSEYGVI